MKKALIGLLALSCFVGFENVTAKEKVLSAKQMKEKAKNKKDKERYVSTFEDALIAAFANNQEWQAEKVEKQISKIRLRQSEMNFLPSITGSVSSQRSNEHTSAVDKGYIDYENNISNLRSLNDNPTASSYTTTNHFGITVKQNIFAGWQTINAMSMRTNEDKATYHSLKAKGSKLIVDVLDAYSDVWKFRQVLAARIKMEENLKNILESQRTKLSAGISTPAEVAAAEANYQTAVYHRISTETELFSAESKFEKITGVKLAKKVHLPDLHVTLPKNLDQFMANSMRLNHSILESKFKEKASLDALNVARGKLAPSVDASLQYGRSASYIHGNNVGYENSVNNTARRVTNNNSYRNTYSGTVEMTIPLFANSGNDYSEIGIAEQNAKKAQFTANNTVLTVKEQCVVNWNTYIASDAMIVACRTSVDSAQLSSESNQEESELGMKSNTEVWDQENKLQESKINFADSRKKRLVAAINIMYLMGRLELADLIKDTSKAVNKIKTANTRRRMRS